MAWGACLRAQRIQTACALAILLSIGVIPLHSAPDTLQLDSNETLFDVMAAVNAAGYDDGMDLPDNSLLRKQVRDYLASRRIDVLPELKLYYRHHLQKNGMDLSQYTSFALSVTGPPDFAWKGRDVDVPPDAVALDGFQPLMIDFYRQANLEELWKQVQPAYEKEIARYHSPILNMTETVDAYLRIAAGEFKERRFHAWVELLTAPELVQTRSYADDVYVIISPSEQPPLYDIRHAYLFFQIDPMMIQDKAVLHQKDSLRDLVQTAPLDDQYKTDFVLLATQSLIKAVEARLDKDSGAIERAVHQGFILTPFFSEQLPVFERQELGMRYYAEDMINAIDLSAETARLSTIRFDAGQLKRAAKQVAVAPPEASPAGKILEKAESLYSAGSLDEAKGLFTQALQENGEPAEHAQAWYGLARIAVKQKDPASVYVRLFEKTLESSPDDFTRAWTDYYLGGIYEPHDFILATKYYQDALAVNGASDKVIQLARSRLDAISKNQEKQTQ